MEAPLATLAVNPLNSTGSIFGSSMYHALTLDFDDFKGIEISKGLDKSN